MTRPLPGPSTPPPAPGPKLLARVAEPIRTVAEIAWITTVVLDELVRDITEARRQRKAYEARRSA